MIFKARNTLYSWISNCKITQKNTIIQIYRSNNIIRWIFIWRVAVLDIVRWYIKKREPLRIPFIKDWQLPTFPQTSAVSSALKGLTSLFGMGRGEHLCYSHQNILLKIGCVLYSVLAAFNIDYWKTYKWSITESFRVISTTRLWHYCLYTCSLSRS